ncbi:helix-turn-helix domain-containing protein [Candidatus Woesearchaeota archaeon]|nr:helix-turn-helix domain-containing protein [Candidatus Woesearchaeota archaeon]
MWVTKLKLRHDDCPIVTRCEKFHLIVYSYPSTWYSKNGFKYATTTCFFNSPNKSQKEKYLKDLSRDRRLTHLESSKDIFSYEIRLGRKGEHVMLYHSRQLFFVKPAINHWDGHEYWEVASWKREELQKFIRSLKKHMSVCRILRLQNSPLSNIHIPNVMPEFSPQQQRSLGLAVTQGYYLYPKKITLRKLAKMGNISLSTFQEHLRKAEQKLIPQMMEYHLSRE